MGFEKRTIKIIVIVVVVLLVIGGLIGLLLALLLPRLYAELEVWPRSNEYSVTQPRIDVISHDPGSWHAWYQRVNNFLREYETSLPETPSRAPCTIHNRRDQHVRTDECERAMRAWAPCTADQFYGYADGKPCVFLRLGHVHYWVPEPYNMSSPLPIPPEMPHHIREAMRYRPAHQHGDFIWVSCEGEFAADKENLGPIQYIPADYPPGFPTSRLHTADRISYHERSMPDRVPGPLVAVYFENPRRGVVINVECRIWTRDILYDRSSRIGRARFELFID
ncbi:sodium/potassium-transporting ATPase subunit beta-2-like [Anticarsia gemmatalis]|uniref:sodium/potassium-transporting ATPase subunit beta-2-like n=1 Tax=Anticarsia gemmatalis TaxID=129554 RepID=UPI003F75A1E7